MVFDCLPVPPWASTIISKALNAFLLKVADTYLTKFWQKAEETVADYSRFWGRQVEQVPISSTCNLVGLDEIRTYEREIVDGLCDDLVGVIGIHGMGGVGKTTLLERINNNFGKIGAPSFEMVIWVTVSQDVDLLKIQKTIASRIGLTLSPKDLEEWARHIFDILCKARFVLLLDDLWGEINLKEIGIPRPTAENKCKVILTTRSKDVCHQMGAKKLLELKVLNESESWKLLKENVGAEVDLDAPLVEPFAKAVVHKCEGLPLALITVGRAMADVKSDGEWKEALRQLSQSPYELSGMTNKVLSPLKFSYDRLEDENLKRCLLYCCLYPENENISIEDIIEQWVGEGFLDTVQCNRVVDGRNRGRVVITKLVKASLLQYADVGEVYVKMHDVVREMCLWITGEDRNSEKNNAFLVVPREELNHIPSYAYKRWKDKMRISLMGKKLHLPASSCPHLHTLLFFRSLEIGPRDFVIPQGFFSFMPVLRVLDLSGTRVRGLPDDVGLLTELRYLNLDHTPIKSLPRGFGMLTRLIQLSLNYTVFLDYIPPEAIPVLSNVQVLRMFWSQYDLLSELIVNPPTDDPRGEHSSIPSTSLYGESMTDGYYCWNNLEEVGLSVKSLQFFEVLLSSDTLRKCCVDIYLSIDEESIPAKHLSMAFQKIQNLRRLEIYFWSGREAIIFDDKSEFGCKLQVLQLSSVECCVFKIASQFSFKNLRELDIFRCDSIHNIAWVRHLPCIQIITLTSCNEIEEVLPSPTSDEVGGGDDDSLDGSSLLSLKRLRLGDLPALRRISSSPMLFQSLEFLIISQCPNLEKLPLTTSSAPNIRMVKCSRRLWDSLGAADGSSTMQSRLLSFYRENDTRPGYIDTHIPKEDNPY